MASASDMNHEQNLHQILTFGETLDLIRLPESCRGSACFRYYKEDVENCGIEPKTLTQTVGNSAIFLKTAVFSFIACNNFIAQNEVFNIWLDNTKFLGEIENAFLRMKTGFTDSCQKLHQGYLYALDGNKRVADERFQYATDKLTNVGRLIPDLLSVTKVIKKDLGRLHNRYVSGRQAADDDFNAKVTRMKTDKTKIEQSKGNEEQPVRTRIRDIDDGIEETQRQSGLRQWWYDSESTIQQRQREREQLEAELAVIVETNDNIINRLSVACDKQAEDELTIKAIHAAITAVGHVETSLAYCQKFLKAVTVQHGRALGQPISMTPLRDTQDIRDVVKALSFKTELMSTYCLFMALGDLFGSCHREMKRCTEYFAKEMTANPTPSEARQELTDPAWRQANNNWLAQDTLEDEGRELLSRLAPSAPAVGRGIDNATGDQQRDFMRTATNMAVGVVIFLLLHHILKGYVF